MGTLGERIKHLRDSLGMNQSEFATRLGLGGPTAVSKYEKNQREPEVSILGKIAALSKCSLDWLLTGEGPIRRTIGDVEIGVGVVCEPCVDYAAADPEIADLVKKIETAYPDAKEDEKNLLYGTVSRWYYRIIERTGRESGAADSSRFQKEKEGDTGEDREQKSA
ncbi:MAG: helix-turn-helix domain-containing protein [Nitrospiraceae bacterium]|nr:helix-turn-helix domain-containing protein [Nitrospiraceae bacterium]